MDPTSMKPLDEVLASVFRAPASYTGEDSVEFSCHGSPGITKSILSALMTVGFEPALPGEFSVRAMLNGKFDLVRAEAVEELIRARSELARNEALSRLTGSLSSRVTSIRTSLVDILAEIESRLDYPEDEGPEGDPDPGPQIRNLAERIEVLLVSYRTGRIHRDGALLVVAGRPNAGKSSLFNAILREERSIVSESPGTTRDWIESWVEIAGCPVRLVDTAGLRETDSPVESAGIDRSLDLVSRSDLALYLVDASSGLSPEDEAFIALNPGILKIWNKMDLVPTVLPPEGWIPVSARTGEGLKSLLDAVQAALPGANPVQDAGTDSSGTVASGSLESEVVIAGERQKQLLESCAVALRRASSATGQSLDRVAVDLREAAYHLGEMTGDILSEEILDTVFSRFCLGK